MRLKNYGKLKTDDDYPACEHCGVLEIGSYIFDDGCTTWCLACADTNEPIPKKKFTELLYAERQSRIEAHGRRIAELEAE